MYTMSDFEILELCRKTFRSATNMTIGGFKFITAALGAICEIFPRATHVDLTLASWFLILVADTSMPIWPKLVQLQIEEPALGGTEQDDRQDCNRKIGGLLSWRSMHTQTSGN
jgi:hypothetical protein